MMPIDVQDYVKSNKKREAGARRNYLRAKINLFSHVFYLVYVGKRVSTDQLRGVCCIPDTMKMAPVQAAAFFFLHSALLSEALVAPTRRIGFIREYESTSSFMKEYGWAVSSVERNCHLMERKRNDAYDVAPTETSLQERVEVFLAPAAELLEDKSDGWALSYADLTPDSERTLSGQAFLATNLAYTIVGIFLSLQGEVLLGVLTELCSIASFSYHYTQLQQPYGRTQDSTVRLAVSCKQHGFLAFPPCDIFPNALHSFRSSAYGRLHLRSNDNIGWAVLRLHWSRSSTY